MIFTIPNSEGLPAYQIKPHNSECWELMEYKQVEEKENGKKTGRKGFKWVSLGKYPTTLSLAFLTVYEHILKRSDIQVEDFKETARAVIEAERLVKDAELS